MQRLPRIRPLIAGLFGGELSAASAPAACASVGQLRHLYSASSLGLDNYISTRQRVQNYLVDNGDKFRSKMLEFCEDDTQRNMIFTEDLKNMVHIVENTPADLELTVRMIKKFNAQNKEVRFGNFIFGPIVMRMFHHLGAPQLALECFLAPELAGFFDQLISYQLLVDALYEAGKYEEVRQVFDAIRERQLQGGQYPKHVLVIVFAACYRENSPAAYEYSTRLWRDLNTVGHVPMRKAVTFAAALALAQGAPHVALEIVGTVRQQGYVTVRNLKVLALAQLGRADDALPVMRSVLEQQQHHADEEDSSGSGAAKQRQTFSGCVLEAVGAEVAKSADRELQQTYAKLERALRDGGHVNEEASLEQMLCTEIVSTSANGGGQQRSRDRGLLAASYDRRYDERQQQQQGRPQYQQRYGGREEQRGGGGYRQRPHQSRPGLTDLY